MVTLLPFADSSPLTSFKSVLFQRTTRYISCFLRETLPRRREAVRKLFVLGATTTPWHVVYSRVETREVLIITVTVGPLSREKTERESRDPLAN